MGMRSPVNVEMVSGNYYSTLEVKPQLGRGIEEPDDGAVGSGPVVTISDQFWTAQFGRSPNVIGKSILVNATPMTIVGVNPRGFTGAYSAQNGPDIFLPFSMEPVVAPGELSDGSQTLLENKTIWWVLVMGRLKPGDSGRDGRCGAECGTRSCRPRHDGGDEGSPDSAAGA